MGRLLVWWPNCQLANAPSGCKWLQARPVSLFSLTGRRLFRLHPVVCSPCLFDEFFILVLALLCSPPLQVASVWFWIYPNQLFLVCLFVCLFCRRLFFLSFVVCLFWFFCCIYPSALVMRCLDLQLGAESPGTCPCWRLAVFLSFNYQSSFASAARSVVSCSLLSSSSLVSHFLFLLSILIIPLLCTSSNLFLWPLALFSHLSYTFLSLFFHTTSACISARLCMKETRVRGN